MACINADGTITESARALLELLAEPQTLEALCRALGRPLYLVRSSLREVVAAELVSEDGGHFRLTAAGHARLEAAAALTTG